MAFTNYDPANWVIGAMWYRGDNGGSSTLSRAPGIAVQANTLALSIAVEATTAVENDGQETITGATKWFGTPSQTVSGSNIERIVVAYTQQATATTTPDVDVVFTNAALNGLGMQIGIPYKGPTPASTFSSIVQFGSTKLGVGAALVNALTGFKLRATPTAGGAAITVGPFTSSDVSGWYYGEVTGLTPDTKYTIDLIDDTSGTVVDTVTGKTLATAKRDFRFLTGSCQRNGGTGPWGTVYNDMALENADFFVHQGDLHYADASTEGPWRDAMNFAMGQPAMKAFLKTTPMTYHVDNHDWGGNTSWRDSPVSQFAPQALRHLFGPQIDSVGMYSTWAHGGVRFMDTDQWMLRDQAVTAPLTDTAAGKTMLGLAQRQWLFDTWLASTEQLIVWFPSFPLYGNLLGNGRWGNFQDEANIINAWLNAHPKIKSRIVCIGGDSHNVAADSGAHTLWNLPSLNASPIDRKGDTGATASGTWDIANTVPDLTKGYYSRVDIAWAGQNVTLTWKAMQEGGTQVATWSKTFPPLNTQPWDSVRLGPDLVSSMYVGNTLIWSSGA